MINWYTASLLNVQSKYTLSDFLLQSIKYI